jgi:hypothetical protein
MWGSRSPEVEVQLLFFCSSHSLIPPLALELFYPTLFQLTSITRLYHGPLHLDQLEEVEQN